MERPELERLQAVKRFLKLEVSREKELQEIARMAAEICEVPIALITLLDEKFQYFRFSVGVEVEKTIREDAFCNYTIAQNDVLIVSDTLLDKRFVNNTLVTGEPHVRFYAGAPLTTSDGHNLGSLCVVGSIPKKLSVLQKRTLQILSKNAMHLLEFDASLNILKKQYLQAKTSEIQLRSFFESYSSIHVLIGTQFEIIAFNKAFADFIKKEYNIIVTSAISIIDIIHTDFVEEFTFNYQKALTGKAVNIERKVIYNDQHIWWYVTFNPARNDQKEIIGVSYNSTDITERIEQEQRVLAQNECLRKIAFIQSHELRRPLASILGLMNVFEAQDYVVNKEEMIMMRDAVNQLDDQIRLTVDTANKTLPY